MRQTASALNRGWLTVVGIVLLLAGVAGALLSTGVLAQLFASAGLGAPPRSGDRLVGGGAAAILANTGVIVGIAVVGVVLFVLGLAWLVAQVPRSNPAKPYRLHDDPRTGLTRLAPDVLSAAVEHQVEQLPGVQRAAAVLRGSAAAPELTMKVTASDRVSVPQLIGTIQNQVAADLGGALDTQLRRLAVQIEIDKARRTTDRVTL